MSTISFGPGRIDGAIADQFYRYEALPPNYSLGHNMLAGAFAGIAVSIFASATLTC
jgi:hypothetical protein